MLQRNSIGELFNQFGAYKECIGIKRRIDLIQRISFCSLKLLIMDEAIPNQSFPQLSLENTKPDGAVCR